MAKRLRDHLGRDVRLTDERLEHILGHPEMRTMAPVIVEALHTGAGAAFAY